MSHHGTQEPTNDASGLSAGFSISSFNQGHCISSVPGQEVNQAGNGGSKEHPGELVPVEEREAEERRSFSRVDSGKQQTGGGQEQKPVPARAAPSAAGVVHGENYRR